MIRKLKSSASERQRACIMVLGMPGPGITAVAGVLNRLGCNLSSSAGNGGNPFGSSRIAAFNEELLASAGSLPDDFTPCHIDWLRSASGAQFLRRALSLLEEEFGDASLFVLSEPGVSLLVPFWIKALRQFECVPKVILATDDPTQTVTTAGPENQPLREVLWLRHVLDAERDTREVERFHLSVDRFGTNWVDMARTAEQALGLVWPKSIASAEFEVAALLDEMRGDSVDNHPLAKTSTLSPEWVLETHAILDGWARKGEAKADWVTLDRIRAEFDIASKAFGRVIRAAVSRDIDRGSSQRSRRAAGLNNLAAATDDLKALKASLQEERRRNTLLTAEIELQIESRETVESQLLEARAEIAANRERRKEMARVITNREAKIERLSQDLTERYRELATLERQILRSNPVWLARAGFRKVARAARRPVRKQVDVTSPG